MRSGGESAPTMSSQLAKLEGALRAIQYSSKATPVIRKPNAKRSSKGVNSRAFHSKRAGFCGDLELDSLLHHRQLEITSRRGDIAVQVDLKFGKYCIFEYHILAPPLPCYLPSEQLLVALKKARPSLTEAIASPTVNQYINQQSWQSARQARYRGLLDLLAGFNLNGT
jgi:hypothetical protein